MAEERRERDVAEEWSELAWPERIAAFEALPRVEREDLFLSRTARDQAELLAAIPPPERRAWVRLLAPDDAADLVQAAPPAEREPLVALLDERSQREVRALLAYAEDVAGGLMSPRFARLRPDMTVEEGVLYLRRQAREQLETLYYVYVLDEAQRLLGVVSFRELFAAAPEQRVVEVMREEVVAIRDQDDQEAVSRAFARHDLLALPVVDGERRLVGIVTADDIADVVDEEATEDIHRFGGVEPPAGPYLEVGFLALVRTRAAWLGVLFLGEMLTASAMAYYEDELARALVLALFVPLIISSGGNSGSQASTLVIRAMALGELRGRDGWRVARREVAVGLVLGAVLGAIGFLRVVIWQAVRPVYGEHYLLVAATVAASLVGVVTFGTLAGALLPFLLRAVRLDPASASAPFVATLVDVVGLIIYFSAAIAILDGTVL